MDLKINVPNEDERLRQAFRTRVPGFNAVIEGLEGKFPVKDLSATGFAVSESRNSFTEGEVYVVSLMLKEKTFLGTVQAKAMRVMENGLTGFNFHEIDRRQQIKLDKLVLEVQKRLIALKKAKREQQDDQDE